MADTNAQFLPNPFIEFLGIRMVRCEGSEVDVELDLRQELLNGFRIAHGGVNMTVLDMVMAKSARHADPQAPSGCAGRVVVTVEMKTSFLRPAKRGKIFGFGRVMHATNDLAFTEGWIEDAVGKKVAHATGIFKYLRESRQPKK